MPPATLRTFDPAKDAARVLGWFGFAILMVGAPLVSVLSRRALFICLPVGAAILTASYVLSVSIEGLRTLRGALVTPIGLAGIFLVGWSGLSVLWTPFPEIAAPRYVAMLATALIATIVVAHLPERRAPPTLYLLPGGLALTAAATAVLALAGPSSFHGGSEFDPSLIERSAIVLTVLVWPALGALGAFGRHAWSIGLAILVAASLCAAGASIAAAGFALAAAAFAMCVDVPRRTARSAAGLFGALILLAPLLPFLLAPLVDLVPGVGRSTIAAMADWRDFITLDAVRLITGHGLDSTQNGVVAGYLPPHTPRSILFEVWYDLGMLGAFALAAVFMLGMTAAGNAAPTVAPSLLGGMVATLSITMFGVATAEVWYVTLVSLQAVALGLLARASRGSRPILDTRKS